MAASTMTKGAVFPAAHVSRRLAFLCAFSRWLVDFSTAAVMLSSTTLSPSSTATPARAPTSTPGVGSFTSNTRGFIARTEASTSFFWLPPDKDRIGVSSPGVFTAN